MTNDAATFFEPHLSKPSPTMLSVYGTLLLAGSMAAARADDRDTVRAFLAEAEESAQRMGNDANHLWNRLRTNERRDPPSLNGHGAG